MELNAGLLKAIDSAVVVTFNPPKDLFIIRYKGNSFTTLSKLMTFSSTGRAKGFLVKWIEIMFRQGENWQAYSSNVKKNKNYDIDLSETIKILPSSGLTSRFQELKNKKMFKDLTEEGRKQKIFTIEKLVI